MSRLLVMACLSALGCFEAVGGAILSDVSIRRHNQAAAERERQRIEFQQKLLAQAGALRVEAGAAARAGNCARVHAIEQQISYLPITDIEGGYHDTVFLADPQIVRCLDEHRQCVEQRRPECTPPAPVVVTRAQCTAARSEHFERSIAEPIATRPALLAKLAECPLEVPADGDRERAWQWTVIAATAGSNGQCDAAIELDARVQALDREHYDLAWARDPSIARCKSELAAYRAERQVCLRDRGEALIRAQRITDVQARGRALGAVPRCPVAR